MVNQYTYSIPFTEEELHDCYVNQGMTQQEIADKFGTTQRVVQRAMKKVGISARTAAKRNQAGALNSYWRGGRVLVAKSKRQRGERAAFGNGYYYILDPSHPNANKSGYVAEHIAVATGAAGRALAKGEVVHHIDLDKHNNETSNLVIAGRQDHAIWHVQLEEIAVSFLQEGLIGFDPSRGYYRTDR